MKSNLDEIRLSKADPVLHDIIRFRYRFIGCSLSGKTLRRPNYGRQVPDDLGAVCPGGNKFSRLGHFRLDPSRDRQFSWVKTEKLGKTLMPAWSVRMMEEPVNKPRSRRRYGLSDIRD
jgi:hypothetical protein